MSAPVKKCEVTPLEALRRLCDVARKVDASESGEFETLLQGELAVAESVLRDTVSMEAVGFVSETAVRQLSRGFTATIFPTCNDSDGERIGLYVAPVVPVAAQPVVPEGWRVVQKKTCYVLVHGNLVVASLAGPDAEANAAIIANAIANIETAAPSLEAQPAGEVERDAARYRWLIAQTPCNIAVMLECSIGEINDEIDAAMAQGEKHERE